MYLAQKLALPACHATPVITCLQHAVILQETLAQPCTKRFVKTQLVAQLF